MAALKGKYVAYLRTSELPHSRLKRSAQSEAIDQLLELAPARVIKEFKEVEPLISGKRPALEDAIAFCKRENARLIFGKMNQMRGLLKWLGRLHEEGVGVAAADVPDFSRDYYWRLYNRDRSWRYAMSDKVTEALAKAKSDGAMLGGSRGNPEVLKKGPARSASARQARARWRDRTTFTTIELVRTRGVTSLTGIAERLNQMGLAAPRGGAWSPTQVRRIIRKFEEQ
ncbi:recombinase family protein [Qipengyuania sp. GH38]|uniref:recombinase family protein n=1 Tax=Qipengyuania intermedia TaxID=2867244 RepID=UPI001C86819B|nr:recombinase family protein [Qipengyuania intermedia]MBX7514907.1 recombinase family protein [Qipengyuania intermedia]